MKHLLFIILILFSTKNIYANEYTKDLTLPEGAEVLIVGIDKKNKMIEVNSVKFPGEDASWVKVSEFGKSIEIDKGLKSSFISELAKGNEKLIGRKFKLKKVITTYVHKSVFK